MSSFLVNMNFILVCFLAADKLELHFPNSGDYIDNLRSKHVAVTVFFFMQ